MIVRVNDRGPFLHNRIMDLSYAAALKVGYLSSGSGLIEVEMLSPADIAAGRIPVTTNSLYIAAATANGRRREPVPAGATDAPVAATGEPSIAAAASASAPSIVPVAMEPLPEPASSPTARAPDPATVATATPPLPASYAARGIPSDLIPDPSPPPKLPEVATSAGYYLQLGAFRVRAGADSFAAHVTREIDPAIASKVHVSDANGFYRVRIGPYALRADADSAASDLRAAIAQPVVVMPEGSVR